MKRHALIANFTLVTYTASMLLASAAPVLAAGLNDGLKPAPAVADLPMEPDTQFDAIRWYDTWWNNSIKGMSNIPSDFVHDMKNTYSTLKSVFKDGVKVGNVMIIRGGPDTAKIAKYHFERMGIHYLDSIRMLPEHVVKAGEHFADAGKHIAKVASENAQDTANVAAKEGKAIVDDAKTAGTMMSDVARWMGRNYETAGKILVTDVKSDAIQTGHDVRDSVNWTGRQETNAINDTGEWMKNYYDADTKLADGLGKWTVRQPGEGWEDTKNWTTSAAQTTGRWTRETAVDSWNDMKDTVKSAGRDIVAVNDAVAPLPSKVAEGVEHAMNAEAEFFGKALKATTDPTLLKKVVADEVEGTKKSAKWLWKKGYDEGLKEGFELAGDNYFAGDVEGIAVGTFYSVAAVAEGVGYILVLEPLAFTGHVGLGVTKTVGLVGAGAIATTGVGAGAVVTEAGTMVGGAALTVGAAAVTGIADAGAVTYEGGRILLHGAVGAGLTTGAAVVGGMYTAGAATAGVVRTVGATAVGGLATMAVGTAGLGVGEAGIVGAGALRMAGVGVAGTALTAGALAYGGLRMTGDVAWGTVKMAGITGLGAAGEVLIPTVDAAVTTYRVSKIAGTAIVENGIITPAVATWDILTAITLGGWEIARDPVLGTYHLVAGATGFSYRLVGLTGALAVTAVAGTLYAVAHAPISLLYYGGMWTISAGAKLLDGVIAPFNFSAQNRWKDERRPQLEEILGHQDRSVLDAVGSKVTYIRVVFSGQERGKVNFFTTETGGKTYKFSRVVRDNCLVVYKSKDTPIVLDSQQYDRQCVGGLK